MNTNINFSSYYDNINKSLKHEVEEVNNQIVNNLNKIEEISKTHQLALPLFGNDGNIDFDQGKIALFQRPLRGFIQRNLYSSISQFNDDMDHIHNFTKFVKNYFKNYTPKLQDTKEVHESLEGAIQGLNKLKAFYHEQKNSRDEVVIKHSIKDLQTTLHTMEENARNIHQSSPEDRLNVILKTPVLSDAQRLNSLKKLLDHWFIEIFALQDSKVKEFFKTSLFASQEKNQTLFLASIMLLNQKEESKKILSKIYEDIREIELLPITKKEKKEIELSLLETSQLFNPFIEARKERRATKEAQSIEAEAASKKEQFKSDYIAKAALQLLAGGGLAALAWKYPKLEGVTAYAINFALSAYQETGNYWRSVPQHEKLLLIDDIEKLTKLEHKTPGTILGLINKTIENRTKQSAQELETMQALVEKMEVNFNLNQPEPSPQPKKNERELL